MACGALALAVIAALGVASPRARTAGRERAARAVAARLGSTRVDDRMTWVAPDPSATAEVEHTRGDEPLQGARRGVDAAAGWLPSVGVAVAVSPVSTLEPTLGVPVRTPATSPAAPALGRAPPLA